MTWRPDSMVAASVQRDDQFLIFEDRIQGALVFNQPAGHVEDAESVLDAVVRETLEETAWHLQPRHLLGLYLWRNPANGASILRVAIVGECIHHDRTRQPDQGISA